MTVKLQLYENKLNFILWALFFAIFIPLFAIAFFFCIPAEDAVILYEYAKNLASTGIITYGGGTTPIEGATDFLWMIVIAGFKAIGINEFATALTLNFFGLVVIGSLFNQAKEKIIVGVSILLTPFLYASLYGFSAIFFSAFYLITLKLLFDKSEHLYKTLLILCLVRPDGVIWGAGCVLLRALQSENSAQLKLEIKRCTVWLVIPGSFYFIWRYWYFAELLPLPFVVKVSPTRDLLLFYKESLINSVFVVLAPILFCLIAFSQNRKEFFEFIILLVPPILFYSAMSLEQNIGNRFMAPLFFAGLYLILKKYGLRALILFFSISVTIQLKTAISTAAELANSSRETVYYLAQDMRSLNGRMLVTEAGRMTYYSNWFSEDSWGLNTARYAHRLIKEGDVKAGNYDLIVAHCDLSLLKVGSDLNHDKSRTWNNQCKTLVSYIKQSNYEIFLVPFLNYGPTLKQRINMSIDMQDGNSKDRVTCKRYDVYAVSTQYTQAAELKSLLSKHQGIPYDLKLNTLGDAVCFNYGVPFGNRPI